MPAGRSRTSTRNAAARSERRRTTRNYNDLWRTVADRPRSAEDEIEDEDKRQDIQRKLGLPEENLLYFIEKHAPRLEHWQRELLRIVRHISQYFYPQQQTKMMNEGCATFCTTRS